MKKLPTDLNILENIYAEYQTSFRDFIRDQPNSRETRIYVPIDTRHIAKKLDTDPHVLFGRLYYHLDHKYRYKMDDGSDVHFFAFQVGSSDLHCVNYPYLAGILAEYRAERKKHMWSFWFSVSALVISLSSIVVHVLTTK